MSRVVVRKVFADEKERWVHDKSDSKTEQDSINSEEQNRVIDE